MPIVKKKTPGYGLEHVTNDSGTIAAKPVPIPSILNNFRTV